jgi:PAS domain S-box-containing protein
METVKEPTISRARMKLLLVGDSEEDLNYLGDLLGRSGNGHLGLDHVRSPEEAAIRLGQATYDLLLCEYKSGDGAALRLLHEVHRNSSKAPVIFLSDHVDEITLDTALKAGTGDFARTSTIDQPVIAHTIRYTIGVYCKERQRQKAEDTLRKLWRAVEQSADLVIITDRTGVIEYVNPAFEKLTGYTASEVLGRTPRFLKSGQQTSTLYQELCQSILSGSVYRGTMVNRKKNGDAFVVEKTITPLRDSDGEITHFISNDRDITDQRRLETQLQQAQKMDAIGRLAGEVSLMILTIC